MVDNFSTSLLIQVRTLLAMLVVLVSFCSQGDLLVAGLPFSLHPQDLGVFIVGTRMINGYMEWVYIPHLGGHPLLDWFGKRFLCSLG